MKDKVAIVTGSTSGIGAGISKMFGTEGAEVVVCGRNVERGQAVVDAIESAGGEAFFHTMDLTQPETVDTLFADVVAKWGKIDVLVNNAAGMALKDGCVDEISLEDWDAVFASDILDLLLHQDRAPLYAGEWWRLDHQHRIEDIRRWRPGHHGVCMRESGRRHAHEVHSDLVRQAEHSLQLRAPWPHRHAAERGEGPTGTEGYLPRQHRRDPLWRAGGYRCDVRLSGRR